jgi:competence protein ComEA
MLLMGLILSSTLFAKVDINHATVDELVVLKGIGVKKAESILAHIKENGCFSSADELVNVKGIGEKLLHAVEEKIEIKACKKKKDI